MVFIIAEIGSNWSSFQEAKDSISLAKNCGADAVKFQLFNYKGFYGFEGPPSPHEMPVEWLPKLKEKADAVGIEFMCTAFSEDLYEAVDPYVKRHKIASSDNCVPQILQKVLSFGKPVIISLGATSEPDITKITRMIDGNKDRTTLMYCVAAYPSTQHNLFQIDGLRNKFPGFKIGLSDHSTDIYTSLSAVRHFAVPVLEKHVNFFESTGPDSGHSLDGERFKTLCGYLNGSLNPAEIRFQREEKAMVLRHNRRLIATKDLKVGDVLRYGENYGAFRSLEDDVLGTNPLYWDRFEGMHLLEAVKCGKGLRPAAVHRAI